MEKSVEIKGKKFESLQQVYMFYELGYGNCYNYPKQLIIDMANEAECIRSAWHKFTCRK